MILEFTRYLEQNLSRKKPTIIQYESYVARARLLFGWPLEQWPLKSPHFSKLCREFGYSRAAMFKMRQCILVFWGWLRDMGYVTSDIRIPKMSVSNKTTPLKHLLTPDQVLGLELDLELKYIALLCYFFSLRPQEAIAVKPADYAAGANAQLLECIRVFMKADLYHKLAVKIERQRHSKKVDKPKAGSAGWVACFSAEAAKEIVKLARETSLEFRMDSYQRRWHDKGFDFTLKDLRRASLYWLGHYTSLNVVELKNHARHSSLETTSLYVRRPDSDVERGLDLDA